MKEKKEPTLQDYKISLKLRNIAQVPLTLKWNFGGKENSVDVPVGATVRYTVTVSSLTKPDPLNFKVYKKGTGQQLGQINGQQAMQMQPLLKPLVSLWKLNFGKFLM